KKLKHFTMMGYIRKKGQVISVDIAIALGIFMVILAVFFWAWNETYINKGRYEENNELSRSNKRITNMLLNTKGFPEYWHNMSNDDFNKENVSSLGLVDYNNLISYDKIFSLAEFNDSNYDDIKTMIGLSGSGYDFEIKVWIYDEGFSGNPDFKIGLSDKNASYTNKAEKFFVFSNKTRKEGKLSLKVFK
ncbi:MAG: hypothetical protein ACOCP4_06200, partial [Candidatus Woesearchaeota archaeon]